MFQRRQKALLWSNILHLTTLKTLGITLKGPVILVPTVIGAIVLLNVILTLSVRFQSSSRMRSMCVIPCFSAPNICLSVFSPKFLSIPLTIPLLIFNLVGLLAFFEKKLGDFVLTKE